MIQRLISLCFFVVCIYGCGYTTGSTLSSEYQTISIEKFVNNIDFTVDNQRNVYLPLLEVDTRNAIVDRFLFDGHLKVAEGEMSDLVLKGTLKNYQRSALRYTENDDVQEYRIYVYVSLQLWDNRNNEMLWEEPNFVGESTYFLSGSQAISEEQAVKNAIVDLARRIVERTVESW